MTITIKTIQRGDTQFAAVQALLGPLYIGVLDRVRVESAGRVWAYFWDDKYSYRVGQSPAQETARAAIVAIVNG